MIPPKIHYCWLSGEKMPLQLKKCMKTWERLLPDYELVLWDAKKFDFNQSIFAKQAFENRRWAFAADYIRLFALYTKGGLYLDTDVSVVLPRKIGHLFVMI